MIDLTPHTQADSDCIVAADLATGPKTILITNVTVISKDKKGIEIHYEGMGGKPYRPCKSMLRLLCELWETKNGEEFIGRGITLYREPNCLYQGQLTPGIRICAMSHILKSVTVLVTEKRGKANKYEIAPLTPWPPVAAAPVDPLKATLEGIAKASEPALAEAAGKLDDAVSKAKLTPEQAKRIKTAIAARRAELNPPRPRAQEVDDE
jgi:hypothetical protein